MFDSYSHRITQTLNYGERVNRKDIEDVSMSYIFRHRKRVPNMLDYILLLGVLRQSRQTNVYLVNES